MQILKILINSTSVNNWITYVEDRPFNDKRYYISNKKLKQLGWNINVNFDIGLQELVTL